MFEAMFSVPPNELLVRAASRGEVSRSVHGRVEIVSYTRVLTAESASCFSAIDTAFLGPSSPYHDSVG